MDRGAETAVAGWPEGRRPKVMFYVQHLLGIGHLARASHIAGALARDGFAVTMVTGGMPVAGFPGPGVEHIALPAIAAGPEGFSDLVDAEGAPVDAAFKARRRDMLLSLFRRLSPDIVLIEAYPFGRRQVRFELLPLLDLIAETRPRPRVFSSVRDILQGNRKPGRNEESLAILERSFDGVLVHGDPGFVRLEDSFPLAARLRPMLHYTGLVAPEPPAPPTEHWDVVVSAGGGAVGGGLIRAALAASERLDPTLRWCLVTGPNLPQADYDAALAAAPERVSLFRFRENFARLLAGARVSVSQAGYNTVCDVFRAGCRSVLVPFAAGGETEQSLRAARLKALGAAEVVAEAELSSDTLTAALKKALAGPAAPLPAIDLDGAAHTARILRGLLQKTPQLQ